MDDYAKETGENDFKELMLEDELKFKDLLGGGARFTLKSNFEEPEDLFPELHTGEEGILLNSDNFISPWERPFSELIPHMTNIGNNIYKKIVKYPIDNNKMEGKCRVIISYSAYMENEVVGFDSTFMRDEVKVFVTDNYEVLEGLELAVKSMKRGEESQFIIPYVLLYGELGCPPRIKPKADILFVIQLKDYSPTGDENAIDNVPDEDKRKYKVMITKILEVKASGIDYFRQEAWMKAASSFHKAINRLEICQLSNESEVKEQQALLLKLYTNIMICYNKVDRPNRVCSAFNDLSRLIDTSKNGKALFQHGKALMALGEYGRARSSLVRAYRLRPNDTCIAYQLKLLDERQCKYKELESNLWRKAMGNTEPYVSKDLYDIGDDFKKNIAKYLIEFKNNNEESKLNLPEGLTRFEISTIEDLAKDMKIKLVISDIRGKKGCYLSKPKII